MRGPADAGPSRLGLPRGLFNQLGRPRRPVVARRPLASPRRAAVARAAQDPPRSQRTPRGESSRRGSDKARARPRSPARRSRPCRRPRGRPAPARRPTTRAPPSRARRGRSPGPPAASPASRRASPCSTALSGTSIGSSGRWLLVVASTRTGSSASPSSAAAQQLALRVLRRAEARRPPAARPLRDLDSLGGTSKNSGPVTCVLGPAPRVLELGEGRDERKQLADPAVESLQRRQPSARARLVHLVPPAPQPVFEHRHRRPPRRRVPAACAPAETERVHRLPGRPAPDRRGGSASPCGTPATSAARVGASVRMSLTTRSGSKSSISARQRPRRAAPPSCPSGVSGPGEGTPCTPAPPEASAPPPRPARATAPMSPPATSCPRRVQLARQRDRRERMPGVAESRDDQPQRLGWARHCAQPTGNALSLAP